jgi:putative CocE/NonD family hydrolase
MSMPDASSSDAHLSIDRDVMVPMRDGTRLRTDVYRPAGPGLYPVLLIRTPYHPDMSAAGVAADPNIGLARLGYAVVSQHCRGRFGSEGDFAAQREEAEDGYDAVQWAAAQPWSNGRVGMVGASYGGMTQWAAAASSPPGLVAVTPASCPWSYFDGIPYVAPGVFALDINLAWTGFMARYVAESSGVADDVLMKMPEPARIGRATGVPAPSPDILAIAAEMRAALLPLLDERPWTDVSTFRQVAPWWRDWLSHPSADDPFWAGISPAAHPQDVRVPALITTGWYDQFLPGGINAFTALRNRDAGELAAQGTRMIIGFWGHGVPGEPIAGHLEGIDAKTGEAEATGHLLSFLETWVKGVPGQTSPAPIRLYVMGANEWRDEHEWPLARTNWRSFYLNSGGAANTLNGDGTLAAALPGPGERPDVFEYDPANPVPQIGGRVITLMSLPGPGPFDQRRNEERPDVLVYTSEPLAQDMEVTGPVTVELWTSSSAVSTDFTAKLLDVFPDGRSINICEGIVRTCCASGRHEPKQPGEENRFDIDLAATSNVFFAGHRIRVEISSSLYPTYDPNPNTGRHLADEDLGAHVVARNTIFHDSTRPSRLILPVIPS